MKKAKSILCGLLAVLCGATAFAGCTGAPAASGGSTESGGEPAGDGGKSKLTITATMEGNVDAKESMVEDAFQKLMSEKLGREVEIKYEMIPGSEYGDKAKLLLASDDITDFFQIPFLYDYSKQAADGMFVDLYTKKDQLKGYFDYIDQTNGGIANVMNTTGNVYGIAGIGLPRFPKDSGMLPDNLSMYRYDVFEKLNLKIPETLDELFDAAMKLKEAYPETYPVNSRWKDLRSLFFAHHTQPSVYWNGEKYVMGLLEEGYKEAIAFANKLYSNGLLDPEYIIETDDTLKSKEMTNKTFIVMGDWFTTPGEFTRLSTEGQIFAAALFPDNPKYGKCWQSIQRVNEVATNIFANYVVSSKAADIDGVLEFINRCYDDDVVRLISWGIEGETYNLDAEGNPQFIDEIMTADDPWIAADKWGMRASRNKRPGLGLLEDSKAFVAFAPNDWLYYEGEVHEEPIEKSPYYLSFPYPDNGYTTPMFNEPKIKFTDEEAQERSQMLTALETYRDEMQAKFVSGEERMDNWDTYMNGVKSVIDVERFVELHNIAAERYLKNVTE